MCKRPDDVEIIVDLPKFTPEQVDPFLEFLAQLIAIKIIEEQKGQIAKSNNSMDRGFS